MNNFKSESREPLRPADLAWACMRLGHECCECFVIRDDPNFGESKEDIIPLFERLDYPQRFMFIREVRSLRVGELFGHKPCWAHGLPIVSLTKVPHPDGQASHTTQ